MIKHHGKSNILGSVDWGLSPSPNSFMLHCVRALTASGPAHSGQDEGVNS